MTDSRPIFHDIFGDAAWTRLPVVLLAHYANRPYSNDRVTVEGVLTIRMSKLMAFFSPVLKLTGMLTPWAGENIPCTVHFRSQPKSNIFVFERWFHYPGRKPYVFRSELVPRGGHEVTEYFACGLGWRCTFYYDGDKVILRDRGFAWRLFGLHIPLPGFVNLLLGQGGAYETATGDNSFYMRMEVNHFLFDGVQYGYDGTFTVTEVALQDG